MLVRLTRFTGDLAIRGLGSRAPAVFGSIDRDLYGSILAPSSYRSQLDIEQPVVVGWDPLGDLSMSRVVGARATSDRKPVWLL